LLNAVSESTSDPIFVKNRQGLMIFANPATLHKLGKTWEETMYRASRELFMVPEEAETIDRDDRRVMASGKPEKLEQTLHLPEGVVTFQTAKVPWFGKDGSVQGSSASAPISPSASRPKMNCASARASWRRP
jgi:PAS domain-containing protein